jgi:cytochrome d ubiquinol oxidase subunit I
VDVDPVAAMASPAALAETLHMTLAAFAATGFAVAGVHAFLLRRDRSNPFHRRALAIAFVVVGGVAAVAQPLSGDYAAKVVARTQPAKLAAMEGQFRSERRAPLRIRGLPDPEAGETRYALEVPAGLSLLAYGRPDAQVIGLNHFAPADRPDVRVVHVAFQVMVACGMTMVAVALWGAWRRRTVPDGDRFLWAVIAVSPLGMLAVEAGWVVTEVGRQPWTIHGVMRTSEAATDARGLWASLLVDSSLYLMLGGIVVMLMLQLFRASPGAGVADGSAGGES